MMFGFGLGLGANQQNIVPKWARDLGAPANAVCAWDWTTNRYYKTSLKSMSRNLIAYQQDAGGEWDAFAVNTLRRQDGIGALLEVASTNGVRDSAAVSPSAIPSTWSPVDGTGLTRTVLGNFVVDGINVWRVRWQGSISSGAAAVGLSFDGTTNIPAANGQAWSMSIFARVHDGDFTNIGSAELIIMNRGSGGTNLGDAVSQAMKSSMDGTLRRFEANTTLANASVQYVLPRFLLSSITGAINITVDLAVPQPEQRATASSPIIGGSGPTTRPIDAPVLAGTGTRNWTLKYDNNSTETFSGVSGDWTIDAAQIDRPLVKGGWAVRA